jgi:N-acetyltransferase 10
LSLASCKSCLVMDDELNILPISRASRAIAAVPKRDVDDNADPPELKDIKESLKETDIVGNIVSKARTADQAKAILTFVEAITEKKLRSTVALTASRGRGKSAALGLAIAAAVAFGYSNIFVTSPSPENLNTLFEFVFKGFDSMDYKEHLDYELVQSTNPQFNNCIVRVNIFRSHRQTVQYIQPTDAAKLGQAELVVIDEAAAIPLPYVRAMLGPYLVFLASTINGYEGTGRSLSLKLIKQLREQSTTDAALAGRVLREVALQDPIRYASGDSVESWLNQLLCLDATIVKPISSGAPHPSQCDLFYVNRDTLFSYHKVAETFLQRMMALYVSSHYKNSPNDLMLMSDAPAHHLFVLLPPIDEHTTQLPEIMCVVQICLEGEISKESVQKSAGQGQRASGDLIPWTLSQQFQDDDFPSLSGARVVRIATHPDFHKMGYGTRALSILRQYYEGRIVNLDAASTSTGGAASSSSSRKSPAKADKMDVDEDTESAKLTEEKIKPRADIPPLLLKLSERPPEKLHYWGVSFGVTTQLYNFWRRAGFAPTYLRLTPNELTGEHTCIMLERLNTLYQLNVNTNPDWLFEYSEDFRHRFLHLLSYEFRSLPCELAFLVMSTRSKSIEAAKNATTKEMARSAVDAMFTIHDIKRLEAYSKNLLDYHVIIDLIPSLARMFFLNKMPVTFGVSAAQALFLLGLGLQHKTIDQLADELQLKANQVMALFNKLVRKFVKTFQESEEKEEAKALPQSSSAADVNMLPARQTLDEDLDEADQEAQETLRKQQDAMLRSLDLQQFSITGDEDAWDATTSKKNAIPNIVSVRKMKRAAEEEAEAGEDDTASSKKKGGKDKDKHKHKNKKAKFH